MAKKLEISERKVALVITNLNKKWFIKIKKKAIKDANGFHGTFRKISLITNKKEYMNISTYNNIVSRHEKIIKKIKEDEKLIINKE